MSLNGMAKRKRQLARKHTGHPFRHKMSSVNKSIIGNHPFNFTAGTTAGDGNLLMLDVMIANIPEHAAKLSSFKESVYQLANFRRKYPTVTLADVIAARSAQLDGQWNELPPTHSRAFTVDLLSDMPEATTIVVQYKEIYLDRESAWRHATSLNIHQQGIYRADTPYNGYERRFQWKCEYALNGSVAVL